MPLLLAEKQLIPAKVYNESAHLTSARYEKRGRYFRLVQLRVPGEVGVWGGGGPYVTSTADFPKIHSDVRYIPECNDQVPRHHPSILTDMYIESWFGVCVAESHFSAPRTFL